MELLPLLFFTGILAATACQSGAACQPILDVVELAGHSICNCYSKWSPSSRLFEILDDRHPVVLTSLADIDTGQSVAEKCGILGAVSRRTHRSQRESVMIRAITKTLRVVTVLALAGFLQSQSLMAENRMQLKKGSDQTITIELTNSDPIAGFQFSLQARGGIVWGSYEASDRSNAAGLAVYQYLKDDSTLNIVLLAPVRSVLPFGEGIIGTIDYTLRPNSGADTVGAFLSGVAICDAHAQMLAVTAGNVVWNLREGRSTEPVTFSLEQNYPNPFNPSTTIGYRLMKSATVVLVVYDVTGRQTNTLVREFQNEGRYTVQWNARDEGGLMLASGLYFAQLRVNGVVAVKKMILVK